MLNLTLDKSEVDLALGEMPASVLAAVQVKMTELTINLQHHVVEDKLSGQVLKQRSGDLARSIQEESHTAGEVVIGEVFSSGDVKYARIHEFGGKTAPHDIVPTKANVLAFMIGGKQVFAKIVHHPGSTMPERSYLRSSLADQATAIMAGLKQAALQGAAERLRG